MRGIARSLLVAVALVILAGAGPVAPDLLPASAADRAEWRAELRRLERHLTVA